MSNHLDVEISEDPEPNHVPLKSRVLSGDYDRVQTEIDHWQQAANHDQAMLAFFASLQGKDLLAYNIGAVLDPVYNYRQWQEERQWRLDCLAMAECFKPDTTISTLGALMEALMRGGRKDAK